MQTKTLIQAQANVIRITSLSKGNVVKIIDTSAYGDDKLKYGIVIDLMNDGEKTYIEMLEYSKSYSEPKSNVKIYEGEDTVSFFPTSVEEVQEYFSQTLESIKKKIEDKKEELGKLASGLSKAQEFVSGEMERKLTLVSFEEIPQGVYSEQKALKEQKIKELQEASL